MSLNLKMAAMRRPAWPVATALLGRTFYQCWHSVALRSQLSGPGYSIVLSDQVKAQILCWALKRTPRVYVFRVYGRMDRNTFWGDTLLPYSDRFTTYMDVVCIPHFDGHCFYRAIGAVVLPHLDCLTDISRKHADLNQSVPFYDQLLPGPAAVVVRTISDLWKTLFPGESERVCYQLIDGTQWGSLCHNLICLNLHRLVYSFYNTGTCHQAILAFIHEARHLIQSTTPQLQYFTQSDTPGFIQQSDVCDDYADENAELPHEIDARIVTQKTHEMLSAGATFQDLPSVIFGEPRKRDLLQP